MSVLEVIKYILAFAVCYFSFIVLQRHYTERMPWKRALQEGGKHIGIGLIFAIANPIGMSLLVIFAFFIILTLGDIL